MNLKNIPVILLLLILSPINLGEIDSTKDITQAKTVTKAYVNPPNFLVLGENGDEIFTVIKKAKVPSEYEGTLLKLESNDLTDLIRVIENLNVNKVIFYNKDKKIAQNLRNLVEIKVEII